MKNSDNKIEEVQKPRLTFQKKEKTLTEIRRAEEEEKAAKELKEMCENYAEDRWGKAKVADWSNKNKGLFYLPIQDKDGELLKFAVLKPITRGVLDYATTKMETSGMYTFLEMVMRELWLDGDEEILEEDIYFLPASQKIQKIVEGFNASLVKH